ncbi:MAG: type VI secretion system Vgr family protein [Sandaracinaceae bacterium]
MPDDSSVVDYRIQSPAFAGVGLVLGGMHIVEALNEPYRASYAVAHPDTDADVSAFLGEDVVLRIQREKSATERRMCGVVREVREGEQHNERAPVALLEVVPAFWFLSQRRNTRIFQDTSAPDIVAEVLKEGLEPYGRVAEMRLEGTYPKREYCVQYQETDLAFVHRLLEEAGISYTFEHDGDVELMVLRDRNASFADLASGRVAEYQPHNSEILDHEPIVRFHRVHRARSSAVVNRDWNWTAGGNFRVEADAPGDGPDGRERERYEHGAGRSLSIHDYDQGVRRYQASNEASQAETRQLAHAWDGVIGKATTRVLAMAPGAVFEMAGHPALGLDGDYVVTRVTHFMQDVGGGADPYSNEIECIPLDVEYRPDRRTPKPSIASIQTALVTGPDGEEIHVDEHGRIRIQFYWDREGTHDENSSCWVRVQQPWAGEGWGFWWVPRMGMEVVVHFVDGDPDRPLVSSSVYNGANGTPYALPDEKTKSTIRSDSSLGHAGFSGQGANEFRFEDKAGEEEIFTHAEKDYNEVVENDHSTLVHHDQTNTVDRNQTQLVKVNQTENVDVNQVMTIDNDRTVHVLSNFEETVDGTETRHTVKDVQETFDANETRTIGASLQESICGDETRDIGGNQTETIAGNHTVDITGASTDTVTGSWTRTVTGGITTTTPQCMDITTVAGYTATAVGGVTLNAAAGLKMTGASGVTRVESSWNWVGGDDTWVGLINHGATAIKFGYTGIVIAGFGVKFEDTGFTVETKTCNMKQVVTKLDLKSVEMVTGVVAIDSNQVIKL